MSTLQQAVIASFFAGVSFGQPSLPPPEPAWTFGVNVRPIVMFLPTPIQSISTQSVSNNIRSVSTTTVPNNTIMFLSGGLGGEVGWRDYKLRGGPIFNYPFYPSPGTYRGTLTVVPEQTMTVSWFTEFQWQYLIAGYQQNRFNLEVLNANGGSTLFSAHTIHLPYAGLRFGRHPVGFMVYTGPALESINLRVSGANIQPRSPVWIFGAGAQFNFSWRAGK